MREQIASCPIDPTNLSVYDLTPELLRPSVEILMRIHNFKCPEEIIEDVLQHIIVFELERAKRQGHRRTSIYYSAQYGFRSYFYACKKCPMDRQELGETHNSLYRATVRGRDPFEADAIERLQDQSLAAAEVDFETKELVGIIEDSIVGEDKEEDYRLIIRWIKEGYEAKERATELFFSKNPKRKSMTEKEANKYFHRVKTMQKDFFRHIRPIMERAAV